jgi:hypothetical protein
MKDDASDWNVILKTVDTLFYRLSNRIADRTGLSLVDAHEGLWTSFEKGHFRLKPGDDNDVGVEPCLSADQRRLAVEQNGPLAAYRRGVIEEAVAAA